MNAHTLGPWLEILKDFLIPVAAILVPTLIAIWLAKRERLAADEARKEDRRLDAEARAEDRRLAREAQEAEAFERGRQEGGAVAMEAMDLLLQVARETDSAKAAAGLVPLAGLLFDVTLKLQVRHPDVSKWIIEELRLVSESIAKRDSSGRARLLTEAHARFAQFSIRLTSWRMGETDDAWFKDRSSPPVEKAEATDSTE
ncbi:hypothetical protein [Clavibacter michiganensis]|uniref:hypothetical protein n=1 Tax=Clavibacter michiganensis TaxID=28447 RepID=UPI003EB9031E